MNRGDALSFGLLSVPIYVGFRDVFKFKNDVLNVCLSGIIAFEIAEYYRNRPIKIKYEPPVRRRSPDHRISDLAYDFTHSR